jgi:acyl-CoA synthetase (NDP forming)
LENYTSLLDIPEPIDLVIVSVPRGVAFDVLEDCICKDVAAVHFFTSGFAETETEEGIELEHELIKRAEKAKIHLIGPNCMGIFNPGIGLRQNDRQYTGVTGPVGFISQSGTHAGVFAMEAHFQGVDINKSVSFGNGTVLDSTDFLEYFGQDEGIKVIGMYLEGVREGRRFLSVLKKVAGKKPVVIWKGGRTEAGERAIASHTGSLAMSQTVWDVAVRQYGAVGVARVEEMIDTIKALLYLPPVYGDRVAVTGGSGGQSVAIADVFVEAELKVPPLTQGSYDELASFFTLIGGSYRNPVDTGNPNSRQMGRIIEILGHDDNIDNIVLVVGTRWGIPKDIGAHIDALIEIKEKTSKPALSIIHYSTPVEMRRARRVSQQFLEKGIPTFASMERADFALKRAWEYHSFQSATES